MLCEFPADEAVLVFQLTVVLSMRVKLLTDLFLEIFDHSLHLVLYIVKVVLCGVSLTIEHVNGPVFQVEALTSGL